MVSQPPLRLLRYRLHEGQLSRRLSRADLARVKAARFAEMAEAAAGWQRFQIWGCGRDGKLFFRCLPPAARARVSAFLEISEVS